MIRTWLLSVISNACPNPRPPQSTQSTPRSIRQTLWSWCARWLSTGRDQHAAWCTSRSLALSASVLASLPLWLALPANAEPAWKVTPDPRWDRVFQRNHGWNGADGAFSVALPDGWSGWLFSDTLVGPVLSDGSRQSDNLFLHNSWARIKGKEPENCHFSVEEFATAPSPNWFWIGHPQLDSNARGHVFLLEISSAEGPEGWNFQQVGTWLARLDWSGFQPRLGDLIPLRHFRPNPPLYFGAAMLEDRDWTYIYGTRDYHKHKEVVLARVPRGRLENQDEWEFWPDWSPDPERSGAFLPDGSNEFSAYWHRGEARLLIQVNDQILLYRLQRPDQVVGSPVVLARVPGQDSVWTYNAKAHPELGWPLLITYNRNAFPPDLVMKKADRYRPRCLRLNQDPWLP